MDDESSRWSFGYAPLKREHRAKTMDAVRRVLGLMKECPSAVAPEDLEAISHVKGQFSRMIKHDQWDWHTVWRFFGSPSYSIARVVTNGLSSLRAALRDGDVESVRRVQEQLLEADLPRFLNEYLATKSPPLDSIQISKALLSLGFEPFRDNVRIKGFRRQDIEFPIYLKTPTSGSKSGTVKKSPMVIHPAYADRRNEIDLLHGVEAQWALRFFNSNMVGFPRQQNEGREPNYFGIPVSVAGTKDLEDLLDVLSKTARVGPAPELEEERDFERARADLESVPQTTRVSLIEARRGQGQFRDALLQYWTSCAVSGLSIPSLLRASHIKPWRDCTNTERLDPYNGLLLHAGLDAAFDGGYVSFRDDGVILISAGLEPSCALLGITATMALRHVDGRHREYLRWHRSEVFLD